MGQALGNPPFFIAIDVIKAYDRADQNRAIKKILRGPAEAHIIRFLWKDAITQINFEGSQL